MPLVLGDVKLGGGIQHSRNMSHAVYGCWDAYISMVFLRREAVALWERIESLHDRIGENPGHRNNGVARERIAAMEQQVIDLQSRFILHEQNANTYWKEMTVKVRDEEGVQHMFNVDPATPGILGCWNRSLGDNPGAPKGCKVNPVVLQFAPPSVAEAYTRGYR